MIYESLTFKKSGDRGCLVVEIKKAIPWFVKLYLKYRGMKFQLNSQDKLDLSKGFFKKYLTSEFIGCGVPPWRN